MNNLNIEFYIISPLSPTLRMVLPEEYSLKLKNVERITDICLGIMKHIHYLYTEYGLIAYTELDHYIHASQLDTTYEILSTIIYCFVTGSQIDNAPDIVSVIPIYEVENNNVNTNNIEELVFFINDDTEEAKPIDVVIDDNYPEDTMVVIKNVLCSMLPTENSKIDLDLITGRIDNVEPMHNSIQVYKLDMQNPKVRINLPRECDLLLEKFNGIEELADILINHIKKIEKLYNTNVYMDIDRLSDMARMHLAYHVLKSILDRITKTPIPDDLFNTCTGAVFIYDENKKCMGYQDPNAIIGIVVLYDSDVDRVSYVLDNGDMLLSDVIPDINTLMKLMPLSITTIQLTTEDMKYII